MSRTWIISDTHYGHNMLVDRGFRPDGFEGKLFDSWAREVRTGDTIIHLGDVCIGRDEQLHEKWIIPMPGRKILVRGNHDRKSIGWYMAHGWNFACDALELDYAGKRILFSHEPREKFEADLNIHGHLHAFLEDSHRREEALPFYGWRHMLISMERLNYRPVLIDTVHKAYAKRAAVAGGAA